MLAVHAAIGPAPSRHSALQPPHDPLVLAALADRREQVVVEAEA
jgi:hypothetical protein